MVKLIIKTLTCLIFFSSLLFPSILLAWNIPTHKIIAEIAYQHLTPASKQQIYYLLQRFTKAEPNVRTFEQLAAWPDVLHSEGINAFNNWHFIDQSFNAQIPVTIPNAVWAVQQTEIVLQDSKADPFMQAWCLSFLIHITGDLHQPLHASTRLTSQYPQGDHGGNLFVIQGPYKNLHQLWDSVLGMVPSGTTTKSVIVAYANQWQKDYPESFFKDRIKITDPQVWANESLMMAKKDVYTLTENTTPSAEYLAKNQVIAKQQVVLAGYRLAYLLNEILR